MKFPVSGKMIEVMENYLNTGGAGNRFAAPISVLGKRMALTLGINKEYNQLAESLYTTIEVLDQLGACFRKLSSRHSAVVGEEISAAGRILEAPEMQWLKAAAGNRQLPLGKLIRYDNLLRFHLREKMEIILLAVYQLDCCIAVATTATENNFVYATALPKESNVIRIDDCRHPGIKKAIGNSVTIHQQHNVLFLTGANMAGKSTFMKSFAIAVFLAHIGFPVAATGMEFSVRDGIYTSINVPDDLQQGFSHFYAESTEGEDGSGDRQFREKHADHLR